MILHDNYGHGGDIYRNNVKFDFSANVNPLGTPDAVKEAVCNSAQHLDAYPDPYCTLLRRKISEKLGTVPENIICGNGAAELIFQFAAALKPQKALLPVPSFSEYDAALHAAGCIPQYFRLSRDDNFAVTDALIQTITSDTDAVFLCNPNNPTGICIQNEMLSAILEQCRRTDTWLFLDECFLDLTDEENAFSILPYLHCGDKVFVLRAFTKLYGMAGVRLGYGICLNDPMKEKMCQQMQPWNISCMAQAAGAAALDCTEFAKETRKYIRREKQYLLHEMKELGIRVVEGQANFLLFTGHADWYQKLLKRKILIRSCGNYIGLTTNDYRIAVRTHEENVQLIAAFREIMHEADGN